MKVIGNALVYFGLYLIYLGTFYDHDNFTLTGMLIALAKAAPFLVVGTILIQRHAQEVQVDDDDKAARIVDDDGVGHTYFLYLRPFDSTNAFRVSDTHRNLFHMEVWQRDGFDDIERMAAYALVPTAPLLGLGRPGEHRGAGRALTDEDSWRDKVRKLVRNARLIVILPSHRDGTLYELGLLVAEACLARTIFIMPPSDSAEYRPIVGSADVLREWELTRKACAGIGLHLPEAVPGGAMFRMNTQGQVTRLLPLPISTPAHWTGALQKLIDA